MTERRLSAVILAAGAGTRMKSARPKPLHVLCGKPMVIHVLTALGGINPDWICLVVGHGAERVVKTLNDAAPSEFDLHYVEQAVQRGTGDAVSIALNSLPQELSDEAEDADVLVLPGDTPLLEQETVAELLAKHKSSGAAATMLTAIAPDPTGYGRVVRDKNNRVRRIVEERDTSATEKEIDEVNTSVYVFNTSLLGSALRRITDSNDQGELYLTDVVEILSDTGHLVETVTAPDVGWAIGVNDRVQLAAAEGELRRRINEHWMSEGVTLVDPASTYIDSDVQLSADVSIHPNTRLQGATKVESGAELGPDTTLVDCQVGEGARVNRTEAHDSVIGAFAKVGPWVVLEAGSEVAANAVVGSFTRVTD